jgi:hypothetical protein
MVLLRGMQTDSLAPFTPWTQTRNPERLTWWGEPSADGWDRFGTERRHSVLEESCHPIHPLATYALLVDTIHPLGYWGCIP